jgi:GH24 family phage-related lysozyme (muramidase)
MNWYTISKKNKKKRKKIKVIEPYVFDEDLGLLYRTNNGLMIANEEENDLKKIKTAMANNPKIKDKIKSYIQLGIPVALINLMISADTIKERCFTERDSERWFSQMSEAINAGEDHLHKGEFRNVVKNMIKDHEGGVNLRNNTHMAYRDNRGYNTIGYGFNLDRGDAESVFSNLFGMNKNEVSKIKNKESGLTTEQVERLFDYNFNEALGIAYRQFKDFRNLPPYVQAVIVDMCFNLGERGIGNFKKFRDSLDEGGELPFDLENAIKEMVNSRWWNQVGRRSRILRGIIEKYLRNQKLTNEETSYINSAVERYKEEKDVLSNSEDIDIT